MDTPIRHPRRLANEQQGASYTPTLTSRSAAHKADPEHRQQHSAHKQQAKHAALPDFHIEPATEAQREKRLAVAPPRASNPDQSVSMDISAEVTAQKPAEFRSSRSSADSYSSPNTAGYQDYAVTVPSSRRTVATATDYGRQLLSPAQVSERKDHVQVKQDQYEVLRSQAQVDSPQDRTQAASHEQSRHDDRDMEQARRQAPHTAPAPAAPVAPAPAAAAATNSAPQNSGVYSLSDEQLADRLHFEKEIGHGNWGSIWTVQPRHPNSLTPHLPATTLAAKLCHRQRTAPSNARVRSLWNEFKVLKAVGSAPWPKDRDPRKSSLSVGPGGRGRVMMQPPAGHPAIMRFYEFLITPSYAVILMPYFRQPMNVALPPETCRAYFQHLLSGIFWLHQNCVTHNDVKTANTMIEILPAPPGTPSDAPLNPVLHSIPILADFGFAQLHDEASVAKNFDKNGVLMPRYCTKNSWGTPEYLSPERARGDLHDERPSDLWSLGVTFFEIATGRTPFENEEEQFLTKEELAIYYERTISGSWIGSYSISADLEDLIRGMLNPDPLKRIDEADALLHPYFVDSELIHDAETAEDLCPLTDDLDASLGAVVRAQVEAVKAERTRREAYEFDPTSPSQRQHKALQELDEAGTDYASPRHLISGGDQAPPSSAFQTSLDSCQSNGIVTSGSNHRRNTFHARPPIRDPDVVEVGHHSRTTASAASTRTDQLDAAAPIDAFSQDDKFTRKHWKHAPAIDTSNAVNTEDRSPRTPHSPLRVETKADGVFSPVISKYKKSQALLSGAFHGTPMSKAKHREALAKEAPTALASNAHATAVLSSPKGDRAAHLKPAKGQNQKNEIESISNSEHREKDNGGSHDQRSVASQRILAPSPKLDHQQLGSPISLDHSLDASLSRDDKPYRAPQRDAWALSPSGDDSQISYNDTPHKIKDGNLFKAFARTVKRSMSKTSVLTDSQQGGRSPQLVKAAVHKVASPVLQYESPVADNSNRRSVQLRRQQAAERLERGLNTPRAEQIAAIGEAVDSPRSWYSTIPVATSETSCRSKPESASAVPVDGRSNPQLERRQHCESNGDRMPRQTASPATDGDDSEPEAADDGGESDGRKSPTVVAMQNAAARAKAAGATQRKAAAPLQRDERFARHTQDRRRTTSEHRSSPSARSPFDAIAGRLDAMSQHASSLLRLVEETRSTIDLVQGSAKEQTAASAQGEVSRSQKSQPDEELDSEDEVDQALIQRSPAGFARTQTVNEAARAKKKQQRPYSMHELQLLAANEQLARAEASAGNVSHVGENSEGATLVGDLSSNMTNFVDSDHATGAGQDSRESPAQVVGHDTKLRFAAISTPIKAKVKSAHYDNVNNVHHTPMAHDHQYGAPDRQHAPAYATVRKHNVGWHKYDGHQTSDSFRAPNAPGSPESSHWIKVEGHDREAQNAAMTEIKAQHDASVGASARFSMRRTRSFVLAALAPQFQQQQSQANTVADADLNGFRNGSKSPGGRIESKSPAAAVASASRSGRTTASVASSAASGMLSSTSGSAGLRSSFAARPYNAAQAGGPTPSPVSQVPPAVVSPRGTPGKAVTRFLKMIRGGASGASPGGGGGGVVMVPGHVDVSSVAGGPRAYEDSVRTATGTSTTSGVDEYRYYPAMS